MCKRNLVLKKTYTTHTKSRAKKKNTTIGEVRYFRRLNLMGPRLTSLMRCMMRMMLRVWASVDDDGEDYGVGG